MQSLGKGPATKSDKFSEKFQTAFDPPAPSVLKNYVAIIYIINNCNIIFIMDMVAFMQGGKG